MAIGTGNELVEPNQADYQIEFSVAVRYIELKSHWMMLNTRIQYELFRRGEDSFLYEPVVVPRREAPVNCPTVKSLPSLDNKIILGRTEWILIETVNRVFRARVIRFARIRQASSETVDRRPVVALTIKVGDFTDTAEFTLADRSAMTYPILLGREFLRDIALIDVAKSYYQPKPEPLKDRPESAPDTDVENDN